MDYLKHENRPCGAVGVDSKMGRCTNAKWCVVRMRMLHQGDISINHKYG